MDKRKIIISVVAVVVLAAIVGYAYWSGKTNPASAPSPAEPAVESAATPAEVLTDSATQGVLPSIGEAGNPLENKPAINPVEASNPFTSVETNPFQ
ncbi:MAG: hypothetical protein Q8P49_00850 [Candidatus Liptonbacteria bacterium]|nr:hypothetical protein [Candidatus Liptonbacteria bacterium]